MPKSFLLTNKRYNPLEMLARRPSLEEIDVVSIEEEDEQIIVDDNEHRLSPLKLRADDTNNRHLSTPTKGKFIKSNIP